MKGACPTVEFEAVFTFGNTDNGTTVAQVRSKQHDNATVIPRNTGIVHGFYRIRDIVLCQNRVGRITLDNGGSLGATVIVILQSNNIVFAEIIAHLNFYYNQRDLAGVHDSVDCAFWNIY